MKQEILAKLQSILNSENIEEQKNVYRELNQEFFALYNEEQKALQEKQLDLEAEIVVDETNVLLNTEISETLNAIKLKLVEAKEKRAQEENDNLQKKKDLLKTFKDILENEENIGVLFNKIKDIREEWKAIGNIPRDQFEAMQKAFSGFNDTFNYNVNIYKELKDHDLKRNYSLKNQIVFDLGKLLEESNIRTIEKAVKKLQNEWEEVGPTPNQYWEELKNQYWEKIKAIYDKIRTYYEGLKVEQQENLDKKKQLIEQVKFIVETLPTSFKEWEKTTQQLNETMESWKKIGFAPKEDNELVWKEFRSYFNDFFAKKSDFFKVQNDVFAEHKKTKQALIDSIAELINPEDWKGSTQRLINVQNEWKKIGFSGRSDDKMWKEFRAKCDAFFNQKDTFFKGLEGEQIENLKKKQDLIETIKAFVPSDDNKANVNTLKDFSKAFNEIGNVPMKEKDEVYNAYKSELNAHYDNLKMNQGDKDKMLFEARIDQLKESANPARFISQEKEKIRNRINEITKEIANYENNLGFFSKSKTANPLLDGVMKNIEKGKSEIESLKSKLKLINKAEA
jgi:DNA repair exonuclease SbcCD ATPase subunit